MLPGSSYLDELDRLLLDQSDDCMLLTQLDGFLAGVIVCPDLIPPSRWLKCIWGRLSAAASRAGFRTCSRYSSCLFAPRSPERKRSRVSPSRCLAE